jgi:hypothetical protein
LRPPPRRDEERALFRAGTPIQRPARGLIRRLSYLDFGRLRQLATGDPSSAESDEIAD